MSKQTKSILFEGQAFCFTGELADLKRTQAEREVRSRGGLTTNSVTSHLDYLVIGSIPSPGWSYGNY
jgi:DNA ligase (NAD+)